MKRPFLTICCLIFLVGLAGVACHGQDRDASAESASYQGHEQIYVVYYVGASSCEFSSRDEVVDAVSELPEEFSAAHDRPTKFVFAAMDEKVDDGLAFIQRHGAEQWDEVSAGGRYNNETLLHNFNSNVQAPGTPHIIVFEDTYRFDEYNIPHLEQREQIHSTMGADGVVDWIEDGYPLP